MTFKTRIIFFLTAKLTNHQKHSRTLIIDWYERDAIDS